MQQDETTPAGDAGSAIADAPGAIDVSPAQLFEQIDSFVDGTVRILPNLVIAILFFVLVWFSSKLLKTWVIKAAEARGRANLGDILGSFSRAALLVLGGLLAATIVMPSLSPGDLVAGLGVSSVAIGFAFKDILQNWLAGLLILLRQPFEIGDQIKIGDFEGTVDHIETRATIIKTYDGQKAVIPNSDIYTDAVLVRTGFDTRRSEYDIGVGYEDDLDEARRVIVETIAGLDGVLSDPPPEAIVWELAASWINVRARWWTQSHRSDIVSNRGQVMLAVKKALDAAKIDMPFDTVVHMYKNEKMETTNKPPAAQPDPNAPVAKLEKSD